MIGFKCYVQKEKVSDHGVSGVTLIIANAIICSLLWSEETILCGCVQKLSDIEVFLHIIRNRLGSCGLRCP